jgi:hypothetical protein
MAPEEQSTLAAAFDAAGPQPGEPSHPAQDHISLDSVFGEEAARRSTVQPAGTEPSAASAAAPGGGAATDDGSKTGGFSFDEFFPGAGGGAGGAGGAGAGTSTPETTSPKAPGGSRTSGRSQRPPEDEAEADQFQQWLKKLKS